MIRGRRRDGRRHVVRGRDAGDGSTVESLIGGLPPFLAQLNLGIVPLVANLIVMVAVSAVTRTARAEHAAERFAREQQPEPAASRSR